MLLTEIVSTDKVIKAKGYFNPAKLGSPIGKGLYAKVYHGRKTNTVIKVADIRSPNDPYVQFVQKALEHQSNPFFPRIYNAKLYEQPKMGRGHTFVVEMEKLVPLDEEKIIDVIPHLLNQIGIDSDELIDTDSYPEADSEEERQSSLLTDVSDKIDEYFNTPSGRKRLLRMSDNEQFTEALRAFVDLLQAGGFADMRDNNMMVRLTGVGPQLVLTDPVSP